MATREICICMLMRSFLNDNELNACPCFQDEGGKIKKPAMAFMDIQQLYMTLLKIKGDFVDSKRFCRFTELIASNAGTMLWCDTVRRRFYKQKGKTLVIGQQLQAVTSTTPMAEAEDPNVTEEPEDEPEVKSRRNSSKILFEDFLQPLLKECLSNGQRKYFEDLKDVEATRQRVYRVLSVALVSANNGDKQTFQNPDSTFRSAKLSRSVIQLLEKALDKAKKKFHIASQQIDERQPAVASSLVLDKDRIAMKAVVAGRVSFRRYRDVFNEPGFPKWGALVQALDR